MKVYNHCLSFIMVSSLLLGLSSAISSSKLPGEKNVKKRQIYREQVLPHAGGKIPDTAFQTDRLLLNRLQKEGFAIPDGVILEQRIPQVHPYYDKATRAVFHVAATLDGRYTPVEGRYIYNNIPAIETTYLIPPIHNYNLEPKPAPIRPSYRPLQYPNRIVTENAKNFPNFQPSKNTVFVVSYDSKHPTRTPNHSRDYGTSTFISNNVPTISWSHFRNDYITSQAYGSLYHPQEQHAKKEEGQDLSKIPGHPGVDYPLYHEVPHTNFDCGTVPAVPGMYANVETGCQAYHVCHDGREGHQGASFLCTNGTIFNQKEFACDWWYNVDCAAALQYYHLNADPEHNPYTPKKKPEEIHEKLLIHV